LHSFVTRGGSRQAKPRIRSLWEETMKKTLSLSTIALLTTTAFAWADTVTVVTSFPRDMTDPFKAAFEAAHPGTTLEVVSRNTNAAVSYLQETRGANVTDLMWASAPDAFEVLKAEKLLHKVEIKAEG